MKGLLVVLIALCSVTAKAQSVVGLHSLSQLDSTTFELTLKTDSAAIVTVHASEDSTYRSAFIYAGRTIGETNEATIKMDRLRNNVDYIYCIYLGTELTSLGGSFRTGPLKK